MEVKEDETPCSCSSTNGKKATMDLLDEYWFFHNVLNRAQLDMISPIVESSSPQRVRASDSKTSSSSGDRTVARALLRAPSLPPRVVAGDNATLFKLRHSFSSLDEHKSKEGTPNSKSPRHRRPRGINRVDDLIIKDASFRKWKSSSDLECFEVQGFRDLGFVFDDQGPSSSQLARVIPGLRCRGLEERGVLRPYLSEAWSAVVMTSEPPAPGWGGGWRRSAAEDVKERLRFWARAVACNVRQDCR